MARRRTEENDALFLKYDNDDGKPQKPKIDPNAKTFQGNGTITQNSDGSIVILGPDRLFYHFSYPPSAAAYKSYKVGDFVIFYYNKQEFECIVTSLNPG